MTKERLEELIKQDGTVYRIDGCKIKLLRDLVEVCGDTLYAPAGVQWSIKNLYETKEQAEWALKTVAERTERFEPPMWEDIEKEYNFNFINNLNGCLIRTPMFFCVIKDANAIFIRDDYEDELIEYFEATKENYEKACEIVRDLFKGEK